MWAIYAYLWVPLITFAAWLVGFERFYEVMIVYGGFDVVLDLLDWYAIIIITIAACVISWVLINYNRFHGRERRFAAPPAKALEISKFFGVAESDIDRAQRSRRLLIELDERGQITNMTHYGHPEVDDRPKTVLPEWHSHHDDGDG
jgi:biofilm PGA synthesis protein PgaD